MFAAGTKGGVKGWEGTWAAGSCGADTQVQVGRQLGSHRARLRHLTVGGFLEPFEIPLVWEAFRFPQRRAIQRLPRRSRPVSPQHPAGLRLACGGAKPLEPLPAGGGRGGPRGGLELDHPAPSAPSAWRLPACRPPTPLTGSVAGWEATRESEEMKLGARTTGADPVTFPSH